MLSLDPKHTRDLKEQFLIDETGQNVQIFEEVLFFKLRTAIQLNELILCQFDARRLAGGKGHETALCKKEKGQCFL